MAGTPLVPWFARLVHVSGIWCLSGMLSALLPAAGRTYRVRYRREASAAPDNTNKGTQ